MLKSGTYILENCGSDRAVDLNGADRCSLIAYPKHGWANQQWRLTKLGDGWAISSALKPTGTGFALPLLESRSNIGFDLTTAAFPVAWCVKPVEHPGPKGEGTEDIYQVIWPESEFVLEFYIGGEESKLNLGRIFFGPVEEAAHQCWKFTLCEEDLRIEALEPLVAKPAVEDEFDDDISTTTTTTTTVTTTVAKSGKRKDNFVTIEPSEI